jgi:hypothetical protein
MMEKVSRGTTTSEPLTMDVIERMVQVICGMPPEPIGEWMRAQGYPPEDWRLILPLKLRSGLDWPAMLPDYVVFSPVVDGPAFVPKRLHPAF